ncbi:MAG: YkgJ family cysteine cluster protein [Acidobacteria bacterium]|nr:YkgJ family cysteine cluster protein [Acidobacteriota bacterium]MBK8148763.1 YkgJ family cysteine cluster protein [Acidobacteriota bacterium]MBK8810190.1 YkgJ family cysteine cluster protein [Acidobacteriota bacterium]
MNTKSLVEDLYSRVDAAASRLAEVHSDRLKCAQGCASCCVDDITVFEIEAANIRSKHPELLESEMPHTRGACAFLDDQNACRIYPDRPYVCRTQGLPLRWIEDDLEEAFEYRDICPLNEAGEPIEKLDEADCWTIGPFEDELARLQIASGNTNRVPLRDLFKTAEGR